jgi:hypothetical protein
MPDVLVAQTPSPARVHQNARALIGHHPYWARRSYQGGLWCRDHYRICSLCGCIHPADMIELLLAGASRLEAASKPGKSFFFTPNPIAGELVRMGSMPGRVFDDQPRSLRARLIAPPSAHLPFPPTMNERLACHFERPCLEPAPEMIAQPFFDEHTTGPQWAEIEAAAAKGAEHGA